MNKKVEIYGASDDCIELDGDIRDEFYAHEDDNDYLAFSDGTVLVINYTNDGVWRINRVQDGSAQYTKIEASGPDTKNYSDKVTLVGDLKWCVCGKNYRKAQS